MPIKIDVDFIFDGNTPREVNEAIRFVNSKQFKPSFKYRKEILDLQLISDFFSGKGNVPELGLEGFLGFIGEPSQAEAKKRGSKTFINKQGKKLAAVTKEELAKSGLTLRQYLNKQQGKTAVGTKTTQAPKNIKRPVRKDFKQFLPPYDTLGAFVKGGKVMKAAKGKLAKDAFDVLFSKIKGSKADFLSERATDLVKKFDEGKIKLPALKGELRKRMQDRFKKIKRRQDEAEEAGYLKDYRERGKKIFPKKKRGGPIKIDEMQSDKTTRRLKTPPAGSKGKGLRKLPTAVRNKMGYKKRGGMLRMSGGGSASGFGRAAMRPGKDPRSISKT